MNAPGAEIRRAKPRKRKPIDLKSLQNKGKATAWLRGLISSLDFGVKVRTIGPQMQTVTRPVHCNTNAEIIDAFRNGEWDRIERLSNPMLDRHWGGEATHYFVANGSTRCRYALVNIDIDCHAHGTQRGAAEAAEHLGDEFFPGLYHEPSTHEEGRHGYFILDKGDLGAEYVKTLLKELERALNGYLLAQGFDIELCEIKGLPPVVTWGEDDRISNYTAGILAKIPRQVDRFEEWKRTTVLNQFQLGKLIAELRSLTPKPSPAEDVITQVESKPPRAKVSGSIGGKLIAEDELAQVAEDGHYRKVATTLMESHVLKTSGRSVVTTEDVAAFLLLLKFFTGRMNADGTLPVKRFKELWSGLYGAGDVGRAFDCHRFKAIRDYLSDLGLIDWQDKTYVVPRFDESGKIQKGRACKWKAGASLLEMLDWEKWDEGSDESEVDGRGEAVVVDGVHGGGGGEAPFVGTGFQVVSAVVHEGGRGEASFVGTDESPFCLSPDRVEQLIQSLSFVPHDQRIRPVESVPCKPWRLSPDEVTRFIPDFEESVRLMAA